MTTMLARGACVTLALLGASALAQAPETYDLSRRDRWEAGDTTTAQVTRTESQTLKVTGPDGAVMQDQQNRATTTWTAIQRCVEADAEGRPTKRLVHLPAWKREADGEVDACLAGTTIEVTGRGKGRAWTRRAGTEALSDAARGWLDQGYGPAREDDEEAAWRAMLPGRPVAVGETWAPDAATLVRGMNNLPADLAKSTTQGTLEKVETVDGTRVAHVAFACAFPLTAMPNGMPATWTRGGTMHITATGRLRLEGRLGPRSGTFALALDGEAEVGGATVSLVVAQGNTSTVTLGGEIPPLPEPAPAPPPPPTDAPK